MTDNDPVVLKPKAAPPLISDIDLYIKNNLNILLIGPHGVGKTEDLRAAAARHGKSVKYFSCSTMDPFTDLVGIPYPTDDKSDLLMVRPHEVDSADIIFFDELNRAPDLKTLDAILEVVQFRTINGEPLNASAVWASINPVDDDRTYNVKSLDPALVDRFDVYEHIEPKISKAYFNSKYDRKVTEAIHAWWTEHHKSKKADYISPRRMDKIAAIFTATKNPNVVEKMMPPGGKFDHGKLTLMLREAIGENMGSGSFLGGGAASDLLYDPAWLSNNSSTVIKGFKNRPPTQETAERILDVLKLGIGGERLIDEYAGILEMLPAPIVEPWFMSFQEPKRSKMRTAIKKIPNYETKYPSLWSVLCL